jgi:hypothetical protein
MKQIALIFVTVHLLFSCSVHYHLNKATKKGYRCDTISDTISITSIDSFPVIVHDSIVWEKVITRRDTIVQYKTSYIPKTRFEYRMDTRRMNDSLKTVRKMYSDSLKASVKVKRQETKQMKQLTKYKTRWGLVIIAFVLGFLLRVSLSETFRSRVSLLFNLLK